MEPSKSEAFSQNVKNFFQDECGIPYAKVRIESSSGLTIVYNGFGEERSENHIKLYALVMPCGRWVRKMHGASCAQTRGEVLWGGQICMCDRMRSSLTSYIRV